VVDHPRITIIKEEEEGSGIVSKTVKFELGFRNAFEV
jgi:hypothetical protein